MLTGETSPVQEHEAAVNEVVQTTAFIMKQSKKKGKMLTEETSPVQEHETTVNNVVQTTAFIMKQSQKKKDVDWGNKSCART